MCGIAGLIHRGQTGDVGPRDRPYRRRIDVRVAIQIPEPRPRRIRVMRMGERDRQAERQRVAEPGEIVEAPLRQERDLVIVFELVGDFGDARLLHRANRR